MGGSFGARLDDGAVGRWKVVDRSLARHLCRVRSEEDRQARKTESGNPGLAARVALVPGEREKTGGKIKEPPCRLTAVVILSL